jgi:hypothetical protein
MATDVSELPLFTDSVDQYDALADSSDVLRNPDYNYPDDADPLNELIGDSPINYEAWWNEREQKTYAGVYLDDVTEARLFQILYGKRKENGEMSRGYFQSRGQIRAEESGKISFDPIRSLNTANKVARELKEMQRLINLILKDTVVPQESWPEKIDAIIEAFKERYSGDENEAKRGETRKHLEMIIGGLATKMVISKRAS